MGPVAGRGAAASLRSFSSSLNTSSVRPLPTGGAFGGAVAGAGFGGAGAGICGCEPEVAGRGAAGDGAAATRLLLITMAFLSINAAVLADPGNQQTDDDIVAAARSMAVAILDSLDGT